jgi:nucleoside-diphosphate-sugar epimerase
MAKTVLVAGATGNLGGRIARSLRERGANVRALTRGAAHGEAIAKLAADGVEIHRVDFADRASLERACAGVDCVVSGLQGLRDVIVDAQSALLDAAVSAGVPRFVPSDYSIDFTRLTPGSNRNLDLRREFRERLLAAPIRSTSVLIGAFMELLVSRMPLLDFTAHAVRYWGNPDQRMDFTTIDDAVAFTAAAVLDAEAPPVLRVAGDSVSARDLAAIASDVTATHFELVCLGTVDALSERIAQERAADPGSEAQPMPRWQAAQYMRDMFSGRAVLEPLDNDRYPRMRWTRARDVIAARVNVGR